MGLVMPAVKYLVGDLIGKDEKVEHKGDLELMESLVSPSSVLYVGKRSTRLLAIVELGGYSACAPVVKEVEEDESTRGPMGLPCRLL